LKTVDLGDLSNNKRKIEGLLDLGRKKERGRGMEHGTKASDKRRLAGEEQRPRLTPNARRDLHGADGFTAEHYSSLAASSEQTGHACVVGVCRWRIRAVLARLSGFSVRLLLLSCGGKERGDGRCTVALRICRARMLVADRWSSLLREPANHWRC